MKKYLIILFLAVFIIPSIAFASWWNPFSWFKKKVVPPPVVQVSIPTNNDQEIENLKKQVDELKKQSANNKASTQTTQNVVKKETNSTTEKEQLLAISKQKELEYQKLVAEKSGIIYVIRKGDSIFQIANMFGVSVDSIRKLNNLTEESKLLEGETLIISNKKLSEAPILPPCEIVSVTSNSEIGVTRGEPLVIFDKKANNICKITELEIQPIPSTEDNYIESLVVYSNNGCNEGKSSSTGLIKINDGFYCNSMSSIERWTVVAHISQDTPEGTKLGFCITSAKTANSAPVEGLPLCSGVGGWYKP